MNVMASEASAMANPRTSVMWPSTANTPRRTSCGQTASGGQVHTHSAGMIESGTETRLVMKTMRSASSDSVSCLMSGPIRPIDGAHTSAAIWPGPKTPPLGRSMIMAPANPANSASQRSRPTYSPRRKIANQRAEQRSEEADGGNLGHRQQGECLEIRKHGDEADRDAKGVQLWLLRAHEGCAATPEQRQHQHDAEKVAKEHDLQWVYAGQRRTARNGCNPDEEGHGGGDEQECRNWVIACSRIAAAPQSQRNLAQAVARAWGQGKAHRFNSDRRSLRARAFRGVFARSSPLSLPDKLPRGRSGIVGKQGECGWDIITGTLIVMAPATVRMPAVLMAMRAQEGATSAVCYWLPH
ncbi:protein of unknown function [Hyphomicrobium sp. 1Nfss2.1]